MTADQRRQLGLAPERQGLYDPAHEHDACGVGFVVNIKGKQSHALVEQALEVVINLLHRGACGCEANTGDGAGILLQLPHRFFRQEANQLAMTLPEPGAYGVGMISLPRKAHERERIEGIFSDVVSEEGQQLVGWRDVPTDDSHLGDTAKTSEPVIRQLFIGRAAGLGEHPDGHAQFERVLYVIRKRVERAVESLPLSERDLFYVASLSSNTIVYKGMLIADQIAQMFPDLVDPAFESALALVHQRFSTNTFIAISRTTARSTLYGATSTGCAPERRSASRTCLATTSTSSSRSSGKTKAIPQALTTCWSSWC